MPCQNKSDVACQVTAVLVYEIINTSWGHPVDSNVLGLDRVDGTLMFAETIAVTITTSERVIIVLRVNENCRSYQ